MESRSMNARPMIRSTKLEIRNKLESSKRRKTQIISPYRAIFTMT
jgi:hypothetical protein